MNNKIYNVLIVDDDHDYVRGQCDFAYRLGVDLRHIDNWEEAKYELEKKPDLYEAIIIDGRGKLNIESKNEDRRHLNTAISWFEDQRRNNKYYNYVVNSAFLEEFEEFNQFDERGIRRYNKGKEEARMYKELVESIKENPENAIKVSYSEVYEVFNDKYLSKSDWKIISKLILKWNLNNYNKTDFNDLRDVLEGIFKSANRINESTFFPNTLINSRDNNRPIIGHAFDYWTGCQIIKNGVVIQTKAPKRIMQQEITPLFKATIDIVQAFSHANTPPNKFLYHTTLNSFFTFILWFKAYVDKNHPDKL
jgi:hypothetical protein